MSEIKSAAPSRGRGRVAGATAAVVATGALACGICCVLPFALPATVLAMSGGALAWLGGLHRWMTVLGVAAVAAGWAWIAWQSLKTGKRPAWQTLGAMILATAVLSVAMVWPWLEGPIAHLIRR
jgi:hypothetical protein